MKAPAAKLAYLAFVLFFFFVIFGVRMPFQEGPKNVEDITTSNQLRQFIYLAVFSLSALSLLPQRDRVWRLIIAEKWLTFFLLWCALSILWSEFTVVSLKRFFQVVTSVMVIVAFLLHHPSPARAFQILQVLLGGYLLLSAITIALVPMAIDPAGGWRGLAFTKNLLGQASLVGILVWGYDIRAKPPLQRSVALGMVGFAGLMLLGSQSMTSLLTWAFVAMLALLGWVARCLAPLGIGRVFVGWLVLWGLAVSLVLYFEPGVVDSLFGLIGRDTTFTDRTALWEALLREIKQHWLLGCGFDGFWIIEHDIVLMLYETEFVWMPNEGHNGYLDLWNETGVVGLGLFFGMVLRYFRPNGQWTAGADGKWLFVGALMINLMESTLFRLGNVTGILLVFAYLTLYQKFMQTAEWQVVTPTRTADTVRYSA